MCRLCGDRNETVNHINEYSNLKQKEYKSRYEWVGKVILWELGKILDFDQADIRYIH